MAKSTSSDIEEIGIGELIDSVKLNFLINKASFVWGPPGIGKSEVIKQLACELNDMTLEEFDRREREGEDVPLIDLRLPLYDLTDLKGIPYYNPEENTMKWAVSSELPTKEMADKFKFVILLLDEMNAAAQQVMASAYQLTLNRRIGEYILPQNVGIVAAGNRETDRGVVYKMPSPLSNRLTHYFVSSNYDDWEDWAIKSGVNPEVIGFVSSHKQYLFNFDPKGASAAFCTPRSWSTVSDVLNLGQGSERAIRNLISGTVGEGVAVEFMAYRELAHAMPNPMDVLEGRVKTMDKTNVAAQFSVTISMCYEIKRAIDENKGKTNDEILKYVDNFAGFVLDNMQTEVAVMGVRMAIVKFKIPANPKKLTRFTEFSQKFRKYIKPAGRRTS